MWASNTEHTLKQKIPGFRQLIVSSVQVHLHGSLCKRDKILTLICEQVHCHKIRKLWIRAGRQYSLKQLDLRLENKFDANTIFALVYLFLFMYVVFCTYFSQLAVIYIYFI